MEGVSREVFDDRMDKQYEAINGLALEVRGMAAAITASIVEKPSSKSGGSNALAIALFAPLLVLIFSLAAVSNNSVLSMGEWIASEKTDRVKADESNERASVQRHRDADIASIDRHKTALAGIARLEAVAESTKLEQVLEAFLRANDSRILSHANGVRGKAGMRP